MKTIKSVITLAFMLLFCLSLQAQSVEEHTVYVLIKADSSQRATIGPQGSAEPTSYHWASHPHIVSTNLYNPQIVVNPREDGEVYTLTRISACGENLYRVIIRLIYPTLVSVTPLKQCYNTGEPVSLSDFQIVTDPPGYEWMVTVQPSIVTQEWGSISEERQLTFTLNYGEHTSTKTVMVNVYNDASAMSVTVSTPPNQYEYYLRHLRRLAEAGKSAEGILEWFKKLKVINPCWPEYNLSADFPIPVFYRSCCNGENIIAFRLSGAALYEEGGFVCDIPLPYVSIPKLGGLFAHVGFLMGMTIGPFDVIVKGDCSEVSIPVGFFAEIQGGVTALLISDKLFSASLYLSGRGQIGFDWIIGKESYPSCTVDVSLKGKVTSLGFLSYTINYPLKSMEFLK